MIPVYRISAIATFPAIKGDEWQQLTKRAGSSDATRALDLGTAQVFYEHRDGKRHIKLFWRIG